MKTFYLVLVLLNQRFVRSLSNPKHVRDGTWVCIKPISSRGILTEMSCEKVKEKEKEKK